jgi:outer membrane receptor protein involved in Fe transport
MTMRVQSVVAWIAAVGMLSSWSSPAAVGQELTLATRTPRFFYASSTSAAPVEIDVGRSAVLGRVVSLHLERATIGGLLAEIQRQTGLTFAYDRRFPSSRRVTLEAESISVAAALGAILVGTGVDVVLTRTGHLWLAEPERLTPRVQDGAIAGTVTDHETGEPILGATVAVDPAMQSVTTGNDGRYRFSNLSPGTYTVRARYIGYGLLVTSVAVNADQEVTVDFPLEKSAQQLQEVVTTGTIVPTEIRALPTPINVISAADIAERRPQALQDVIRQAVPTAVAFDNPASPALSLFSVRGASSLSGTGTMKLFVDGVEATAFGNTPIDPGSVERIEVVRGPQAATLYGADAAGGVIQIFTKRGDPRLTRPHIDAQAGVGIVETPYEGFGGVLRQEYVGSVRGGAGDVGYNFGGGYTRQADYLPNGEISRQVSPSAYGGMRFARGIITADLSARYYDNKIPLVVNPLRLATGVVSRSRPNYQVQNLVNETYGARITLSPATWWQNQVTAGIDHWSNEAPQRQRRLTTPADTLFSVFRIDWRKVSIGYSASLTGRVSTGIAGSLTLGIDHYDREASTFFTTRALSTTGTIVTSPVGSLTQSFSAVTNTGYFAQAQVGLRDAVFLTGGVRAEENSTFGADFGTPVLPRVGLSMVREVGQTTVKVRGSYGRAIRAPGPGQTFGSVTATLITLANPLLGPEQQEGWDAGFDFVFGKRGSLSVTGYDQTAKDLIVFVKVANTPVSTSQFQNIGRVTNRGIEVEGSVTASRWLQFRGQYGYVHSRIEDLGPGVSPSAALQVGDQPMGLPAHTAGVTVTLTPSQQTTLSAGLTYVGSYRQIDNLAQDRCQGGIGPCQPTSRDYVVTFPGFAKVNGAVTHRLMRHLESFVSVDNLTNNEAYEGGNTIPVTGRVTMVGLHFAY